AESATAPDEFRLRSSIAASSTPLSAPQPPGRRARTPTTTQSLGQQVSNREKPRGEKELAVNLDQCVFFIHRSPRSHAIRCLRHVPSGWGPVWIKIPCPLAHPDL